MLTKHIDKIAAELEAARTKANEDLSNLFIAEAKRLLKKYPQFAAFYCHGLGESFHVTENGREVALGIDDDDLPEDCQDFIRAIQYAYGYQSNCPLGRDGEVQFMVSRKDLE